MRLKELREEAGMKQIEISQLLNISQMAYSYYERGLRQPDINMLIKLSEIFHVSVDYIIENENKRLDKLTEDERMIMFKYRKLNQINKYKIEERIDVFLEEQ
ncbi:MAG: helix-turn-helix transcriptional regulator [Ruminococcus sp.]|nr:helix-turn-helix transcriptional regulator [Ruminococcus sp.]